MRIPVDQLRRQVSRVLEADLGSATERAAVQIAVAEALSERLEAGATRSNGFETALAEARDLHALALRLIQEGTAAPLEAAERVERAIERLADAGPPSELIARAPVEAADALGLDRVVLSRVEAGNLVAETIYCREGAGDAAALLARLTEAPVALEYPLLEAELARRRAPHVVSQDAESTASRQAYSDVMQWGCYLAAPIVLEGRVIGFLHGDRLPPARVPGVVEREALGRFAASFASIFERAVLHQRLRIQRKELRDVASWADARTSELSDSAIELVGGPARGGAGETLHETVTGSRLSDLLTKRELDVAEQLVTGKSNAEIARLLVVSPGTVKFHVKNILRKLNASNRAEATSRYLRLSLGRDETAP